jgi:hypothetical protein
MTKVAMVLPSYAGLVLRPNLRNVWRATFCAVRLISA